MRPRPSLLRVLQNDYGASVGGIFLLVAWAMYFAFLLFDLGDASVFLPIAAIMSAFGLILLVWRVSIINAVFAAGHEAEATITGTSFFRGRGRIEYTYLFQGSHYNSGNAVQETKATNAVQVGNKVIVLVDPNRPKRAFIRDLYQ